MFNWLNWFKKKNTEEPQKKEATSTQALEKGEKAALSEKEPFGTPSEKLEIVQREKKEDKTENPETVEKVPIGHPLVYTNQGFHQNYRVRDLKDYAELVEGSFKMLEGYFRDLEKQPPRNEPLNHPLNLDQAVDEGLGFKLYGQFLGMDEQMIGMLLAVALSHFMIQNYGGQFYEANEPESPLKRMAVKINRQEMALLVYPLEYSMKVLRSERTFESLYNQFQL